MTGVAYGKVYDAAAATPTSVPPGATILEDLKCKWNGKDKLTNINVFRNEELFETIEIPEGNENGVGFGKKYEKTATEKDSFSFELNDEAGNKASLTLILHLDTANSDLKELKTITLGAQNSATNQLYSVSALKTYSQTDANADEAIQKVIDFVGAYDSENNAYIGSPATNFNSIYDFSTWSETDTTYFVEAVDYTEKIYGVLNKTKIKKTFDDAGEEGQNKKATHISQGDMFIFKTQSNKYGVIKINSVVTGAEGSVNFDLKVQR